MKNLKLIDLNKKELLNTNGGAVPYPWPTFFPDPFYRDDRVMPWQFPILRTKYRKGSVGNR